MPKFTHLHVHTHYSLLDGLAKIDDILDRAKELGMDSLAITDHGVLYGAIEFFIKAKERGIKPIIGCEMYFTAGSRHNKNNTAEDKKRFHLILLAKNENGYKNLMKLISIAHLEGFYYKPRIDRETLRQYAEGLIGLSACAEGEVPVAAITGDLEKAERLALEYQEIFGVGNFYLEIQHHPNFANQKVANDALIKIARKHNIPLVATNDIHYVNKADAGIQDILLCIQTNRKVSESNRMNLTDFELYLKSPDEMAEHFRETPDALTNTQEIVAKCDLKITLGETQLPYFDVPESFTDKSYLRHLCEKGLAKRFPEDKEEKITTEHRTRMDYELDIIEKTGYASYFLIVQDFVNWAKNQGIVVGPGRGSAAGSFVSYLVGITNIDPIKYNLLFERFLNPERVSMPDVDMDFADDRRDEVLDYVRKKYGNDHVAQIITFGTMAARAAVRDAGRALGLPYDFCDKAAKLIPQFSNIQEALAEAQDFKDFYNSEADAKKLVDSAQRLEGVARHASMHACGVVITKEPVTEYTPLQKITGKGKDKSEGTVTQYSSSTKSSFVEKIGLLKMDFLGLKNLTIMQNALRIARKTRNINLDIDNISLEDEKTYALLQAAETTGVFQLESSGMKRYLKQLKPSVLEDIIAMVALYRPGPMDWIPDFIAGKHGTKKVKYIHPLLEPILKNTYGVAVYQEQVMQIARDLAGFTLGEADVLRKAMGKKIPELIKEQRIKFVTRAIEQGITAKIAEKVFDYIEPFAGYGFNRSHAACYALIGYQTAYLKAHFPAEFMAALLTSEKGNTDRISIEVSECQKMGIAVLPPDINESFEDFTVIVNNPREETSPGESPAQECIRFGLNAIKNVGGNVAHEIVEERKKHGKYHSLADFLARVQTKDLNKKSLEALFKVGAADKFGERNQLLSNIEIILAFSKNLQKMNNSNQVSLFGAIQLEAPQISLAPSPPASKKEKLQWEKELLGLYVSDHPVSDYREYLEQMATPINKLEPRMVGEKIQIGGVISKVQKIFTKRQQNMLFVSMEDMHGKIEVLVFPRIMERIGGVFTEDKIVLVEGKLSDKDGTFKLIADDAKEINPGEMEKYKRILATLKANEAPKHSTPPIEPVEPRKATPEQAKEKTKLLITLPPNSGPDLLKAISAFLDHCELGGLKVYVLINGTQLETPYCIKNFSTLTTSLQEIIPASEIRLE